MNREKFIEEVKKINIDIDDDILSKLDIYMNFLLEYNKHTNLTAIRDEEDVYLKHFYDSLTLSKVINLNEVDNLLDIGTGAGFPGMIIKIFYPKIKVTLLDSNNKKTKFLTELKEKINVDNLEIINDRVEKFTKNNLNKFDVVTARAVTNMRVLTELAMPLVKKDKYFIAMKGGNIEEINESKNAIEKMNGKIEEINSFMLYPENGCRNIVKIKKNKETLLNNIREYDKIIKRPL